MKNKIRYLSSFIICILLLMNVNAQDALTADVTSPTYNQHCQNGEIDLHINGGFPPYDVVWERTIWNSGFPPFTVVVQTSYDIQGTNDGEDIT
ncbi:MAG: hypothetical protein GY705_10765, partial [Bacteroidetes bacterium]|nr:hypothetical protein [Bacteroidota bacterium]